MTSTNDLTIIFEDLAPMGKKKAAVIIGRFNPPTLGHYKVINDVKKFIRTHKELNIESTPIVIIIGGSKSDDDKAKNPLSINERENFMKASGRADGVLFFNAPNAFAALSLIREKGFEPIAIAAGNDRIDDYVRILDKYFLNASDQPIKHYKIELQRDEAAINTDKKQKEKSLDDTLASMKNSDLDSDIISGSLARRAVELGYKEEFVKIVGLETKPALADKLFFKIKSALGA